MKKIIFILTAFLFIACNKSVEKINYGEDLCHYCSMTVVDKTHAAQVVTSTGKNFKFDSSECMINYLEDNGNEGDMLHILSADYLNPGKMLDVNNAMFIISENIPSPMGAFLSAVDSKESAESLLQENGGEAFDWSRVKNEISHATGQHHSEH